MKIYLIKRSAVVYALLFTSMQIFCAEAEQTAQPVSEQAAPAAGSTRGSLSWAAHQVYGPYRELGSKAWQAGQSVASKASTGAKAAYERAKAAVPTIPRPSQRDVDLALAGGILGAGIGAGLTTGPSAPAAGQRLFEATGLTPSVDLGILATFGITTGLVGARMYQLYRQRMNDKKDANSLVADIQSTYEAINENDNQAFLTTVYNAAMKIDSSAKDDIFKNFIGALDADVASLSKITRSHIVINPTLKEQIKALIIKLNRIKELVSARALEALATSFKPAVLITGQVTELRRPWYE